MNVKVQIKGILLQAQKNVSVTFYYYPIIYIIIHIFLFYTGLTAIRKLI